MKAAAPFLKQRGTEGASVDEIMNAAGVTSGALYSQFKNKDDLCTQVICSALDAMLDAYRGVVHEHGKAGLKRIVSDYLSRAHVREVGNGCTFAALGSNMATASPRAKRAYQERIQALVEIFVDGLGSGSETARRAEGTTHSLDDARRDDVCAHNGRFARSERVPGAGESARHARSR